MMQLHDVVEVTQVVGAANANTKLNEGWKLITVVPATVLANTPTSALYVLGKPATVEDLGDDEPVMPIMG
jgi:hypothetical protein